MSTGTFARVVLAAVLFSGSANAHALQARQTSWEASTFAGASTSAVVPPPDATNAGSEFDSFFPDATEVGFPGVTNSTSFSLHS